MIKNYPVPLNSYTKEEAPYIYTEYAEQYAKLRSYLEPRTAGTIACFGGKPLQKGAVANSWLNAGLIVEK